MSWLKNTSKLPVGIYFFKVIEISLFYRLNDELLHCILKTVVRESCLVITKCQTVARDDFQKLLSTVPVWPSVQQNEMPSVLIKITFVCDTALVLTWDGFALSVGGLT